MNKKIELTEEQFQKLINFDNPNIKQVNDNYQEMFGNFFEQENQKTSKSR